MGHAAERERRRQLGHAAEPERRRQLVLPGYCFCFFSFFFFGPCSMRCGRLSRSAELIGACIRVLHLPPPPPPPPRSSPIPVIRSVSEFTVSGFQVSSDRGTTTSGSSA
mmetsp:Transcript_8424/g.27690  ORF Transcript_8424/g.27690 Transcript_8424/m.27690 type:complete len:109 (+) Transcript_8424:180-506(+)